MSLASRCVEVEEQLPLRLRGKPSSEPNKTTSLGPRRSGLLPKTPSAHLFIPRNVQTIQTAQRPCHLLHPSTHGRILLPQGEVQTPQHMGSSPCRPFSFWESKHMPRLICYDFPAVFLFLPCFCPDRQHNPCRSRGSLICFMAPW